MSDRGRRLSLETSESIDVMTDFCERRKRQLSALSCTTPPSFGFWNNCGTLIASLQFLIYILSPNAALASSSPTQMEVCNMDVFEARCDQGVSVTASGVGRTLDLRQQRTQPQGSILTPQLQSATAATHQLILMQMAQYGRMRTGKCANPDYGIIGCGIDVLDIMDWRCSGRRRCRFKVPDDEMYAKTDCPQQVVSYLEASYTCITVASDTFSRCATGTPIQLTADSGYIASPSSSLSSSSHASLPLDSTYHANLRPCKWLIRVAPGQRINLTLFDFGRYHRSRLFSSSGSVPLQSQQQQQVNNGVCIRYAVVTETVIGGPKPWPPAEPTSGWSTSREDRTEFEAGKAKYTRSADLCGGVSDTVRQRFAYASSTNSIVVETFTVTAVHQQQHSSNAEWAEPGTEPSSSGSGGPAAGSTKSENEAIRFLIRYDAVGCADLQLPGNVIVRRDGLLSVTVSCDNSTTSVRHHLVCKDRQWTGDLPACQNQHLSSKGQAQNADINSNDWFSGLTVDWTYAILTTVGLGVALGVLVGVGLLLATLAYCKRRSRYSGAALRMDDKYCTTIGVPVVAGGGAGIDYYEHTGGNLHMMQPSGPGPYAVKDVIVTPSGECTARLLRTNVDMTTCMTGNGKDELCLCSCGGEIVHPGLIADHHLQHQHHQHRSTALFSTELGSPLHTDYELTA